MKNKELVNLLIEKDLTITVAESCTGGGVCHNIVLVENASKVFTHGFVTYSNSSKKLLLAIKKRQIKKHGVISKEISELMAINAQALSKSKVSIGITGLCGPGTDNIHPVGTVFYTIIINDEITHFEKKYDGTREEIINKVILDVFESAYDLVSKA